MLTNLPVPYDYYYPWVNICLAEYLNSVLNVKALVDTFNQERALVGALSVIVKSSRICLPFVSSSTGNKETVVRVLALADGGGVGG